ncbi:enoyl-CoA hydratase [Thermodesulfobacteriota bacterium]
MSSNVLIIEKKDRVATITLNRPQAMNALSRELRRAIADAFQNLQADGDISVVILTGAGSAFCAGLDLKELSGGPSNEEAVIDMDAMDAIVSFEKPIIGAINGYAITGGLELALACDFLIASTEAKFADTHVRVGLVPGWGLSQRLSRLIGISRAKELSFTGNFMTADQVLMWGLVNRVVPPDKLLETCRGLADDIASSDLQSLRQYKRLIDEGYGMNFSAAMQHETEQYKEFARSIAGDHIAVRRDNIFARGRKQSHS